MIQKKTKISMRTTVQKNKFRPAIMPVIVASFMSMLLFCSCASVEWLQPEDCDFVSFKEKIIVKINRTDEIGLDEIDPSRKVISRFEAILLARIQMDPRFEVLTGERAKAETENCDVVVNPIVRYMFLRGDRTAAFTIKTLFNVSINDPRAGHENKKTIELQEESKIIRVSDIYGRVSISEGVVMSLLSDACFKLCSKLKRTIGEHFPIKVGGADFKTDDDGQTVFPIAAGSSSGLDEDDDYFVCSVDDSGNITVVALAKAQVGKRSSRMTVREWHFDDPLVKEDIYPRICRGDESLNLCVVGRKKK